MLMLVVLRKLQNGDIYIIINSNGEGQKFPTLTNNGTSWFNVTLDCQQVSWAGLYAKWKYSVSWFGRVRLFFIYISNNHRN